MTGASTSFVEVHGARIVFPCHRFYCVQLPGESSWMWLVMSRLGTRVLHRYSRLV